MVIDKLTQTLYLFKEGISTPRSWFPRGLPMSASPTTKPAPENFDRVPCGDFNSDNMICAKALRFNEGDLLHEVPHILNADGTKNYGYTEYKLGHPCQPWLYPCAAAEKRAGHQPYVAVDNIKVGTKLVIWEDYAGRQMEMPDLTQPVYYNPDGGSYFHSDQNCDSVRSQYLPLTEITLGDLLKPLMTN